MFKKFVILVSVLAILSMPKLALASEATDEEIICPQPYGGGVVCGIKTHVPVNTGIADNLPILGAGFILGSAALYFFSKKINQAEL